MQVLITKFAQAFCLKFRSGMLKVDQFKPHKHFILNIEITVVTILNFSEEVDGFCPCFDEQEVLVSLDGIRTTVAPLPSL